MNNSENILKDKFQFQNGAIIREAAANKRSSIFKFQFQNGAIIRDQPSAQSYICPIVSIPKWCDYKCTVIIPVSPPSMFQFQNGAIIRLRAPVRMSYSPGFQFQNGAIISGTFDIVVKFADPFQFQNGAIISDQPSAQSYICPIVSIPKWCDYKSVMDSCHTEDESSFNSKMVRL